MSRNTRKSRRPRKVVEKSEISEALDNPEVDLTDAIDAVRVLDILIEKSFLENLHLFQTLIDQRVTEKGRGWLYSYRILNLHRLVIHEPHSFEYELIL